MFVFANVESEKFLNTRAIESDTFRTQQQAVVVAGDFRAPSSQHPFRLTIASVIYLCVANTLYLLHIDFIKPTVQSSPQIYGMKLASYCYVSKTKELLTVDTFNELILFQQISQRHLFGQDLGFRCRDVLKAVTRCKTLRLEHASKRQSCMERVVRLRFR